MRAAAPAFQPFGATGNSRAATAMTIKRATCVPVDSVPFFPTAARREKRYTPGFA